MLLGQPLTSALGVDDPFVEASATALLKVKPARCSIKARCHGVRREAGSACTGRTAPVQRPEMPGRGVTWPLSGGKENTHKFPQARVRRSSAPQKYRGQFAGLGGRMRDFLGVACGVVP